MSKPTPEPANQLASGQVHEITGGGELKQLFAAAGEHLVRLIF